MDASVGQIEKFVDASNDVSIEDLKKLCVRYFGSPRKSPDYEIYSTNLPNYPRIVIQTNQPKAVVRQVRTVIAAIDQLQNHQSAGTTI
ncbi:MAG: toxin HicA [Candidatus Symbiobacter sp.]|nr:toxin HicA [Candidatus Symbiobacter sp.]